MSKKTEKNLIVGLDIGTSKVVAIVGEVTPDNEIEVIGLGDKIAAEGGLGIGFQQWKIDLPLIADEERFVIGDHFGKEADDKEDREDPQAVVAAPIGLESSPGAGRCTHGSCTRHQRFPTDSN